jgi:hypothetical protein
LGGVISFAVWVWNLLTMFTAVRQTLEFSTGKIILTCIIGWMVALVLLVLIGIILAIPLILLGF